MTITIWPAHQTFTNGSADYMDFGGYTNFQDHGDYFIFNYVSSTSGKTKVAKFPVSQFGYSREL